MTAHPTNSKLSDNSDTGQAFSSGEHATRSLEFLGTTDSHAESPGKSGAEKSDPWGWAAEQRRSIVPGSAARDATVTASSTRAKRVATRAADTLHTDTRTAAPITAEESAAAWQADLEYVWRTRVADARDALDARAKRYRREAARLQDDEEDRYETSCSFTRQARRRRQSQRIKKLRAATWAEYRARALSMSRASVVSACRKRWRSVRCACGTQEFPVGCDNPQLCAWCRKRHWRKWRHRITRSMETHLRAQRASWRRYRDGGMPPGIYLITLTGPHSGDIEQDRRALGRAWESLRKHATAERWWKTYALTWEVTKGESGSPHVHAHVAVISSWIPFDELHVAWRRAMPGALVLDVQSPARKARNESGRAANYLAKYVTKGIEPTELSGRKAGEMLVAFRSRRKVTTSRHFWMRTKRPCQKCNELHRTAEHPCSLQRIAPDAVLQAFAERIGVWVERGAPQVELRWSGDG